MHWRAFTGFVKLVKNGKNYIVSGLWNEKKWLTYNAKRIHETGDAEICQGQINHKQISCCPQWLHSKQKFKI